MSQYNRHAILPLNVAIQSIKDAWDEAKPRMTYEEWSFNISSLRLRTFCRAGIQGQLHCSACELKAEYFAVESFKHTSQKQSFHINLYGQRNDKEVLFTHDHTLARALGGEDNLSNTTVMCFSCNNKKGQEECREVNVKRFMTTLTPKAQAHQQALLDARKNPFPPEVVETSVNAWATTITAEAFTKRIDSYLQKFGWKRRELKEKINEGVIKFDLYPVKD